jgi:hypothetical protein
MKIKKIKMHIFLHKQIKYDYRRESINFRLTKHF